MQFLALPAFLLAAVPALAQWDAYTDCSQLASGFGYICSPDRSQVIYCQANQNPPQVVSQDCQYQDCYGGQSGVSCYYGVSSKNAARGPTDCRQVNADGGFICSTDYKQVHQCHGFWQSNYRDCGSASCFASTTGDVGVCAV